MARSCSTDLMVGACCRERTRASSAVMRWVPIAHSVTAILFWSIVSLLFCYRGGRLACVKVPVLSEHMTETEPRVSTVLRDLQRIFCLRIMLALIVMLAVSATGKPSGMNATATETQEMMRFGTLIQLGWSLRSHAALQWISVMAPSGFSQIRTRE